MPEYVYLPLIDYCAHRKCDPGWVYPLRQATSCYLAYVYNGEGTLTVNNEKYEFTEGALLHVPYGVDFGVCSSENADLRYIAVKYDLFDRDLHPVNLPVNQHTRPNNADRLFYLFKQLNRSWTMKDSAYHLAALSVLLTIMNAVLHETVIRRNNFSNSCVEKVIDYVILHISTEIETRQLSEEIGLNPGYLSKVVSKNTGLSLRNFINQIRINVAEDALIKENISVKEAAERFGFSDIYYFSKTFKKIKGFPPSHVKSGIKKVAAVPVF